ncbi:hypothetical protein OG429_40290 (plasmid) [Streptomyces sp. NBC_00190]|uniref:hypothetical protein n=1 Tax=unclassified Streptomyces TaxID=2593676 RepID=UPI002E2B6F4C|nr:hypothetical protein [Streptomyces sp. NBC_00190]WSZ45794.1 hypothetical protein OG239_44325 [Streptomyces sp. NBC_00868]
MTEEDPGIEPHDATAITAFENALREFTHELNRLHITNGAPSYATIAAAAVRPRLTKAGLNEMLAGTRFTSREALLEFVRVVTTPGDLDPAAAAGFRVDPELADAWRGRWQDVKLLQRQAQPASRRVRATVRQTLDDATLEAEAVRKDAHAEADRIRTTAEADAAQVRAQARHDADELIERARRTAAQAHGSPPREGDGPHTRAGAAGSAGSGVLLWRQGKALVLRPALRPLAAATAVAGLALAAVLAGDSLTGTPGTCQPNQAQAADQLMPRAGLEGRGQVQQAAFAYEPAAIIWPSGTPPSGFFQNVPSSSASTNPSPTPSSSPTPSPTPTPSTSPTPTTSPAQTKPDPCALRARGH